MWRDLGSPWWGRDELWKGFWILGGSGSGMGMEKIPECWEGEGLGPGEVEREGIQKRWGKAGKGSWRPQQCWEKGEGTQECWEKDGRRRREDSGVLGEEGSDPGGAGKRRKGKRARKAEQATEHWEILGSPCQGIPALLLPAGSGALLPLGKGCSLSHSPRLGAQRWDVYPRALPKLCRAPGFLFSTNSFYLCPSQIIFPH